MKNREGFSLIELLIYIGIFAASSVFLVSMLIIFTRIHLRQTSVNEVNQQITFLNNTVERLVRDSSMVDMPAGQATSTLTLRMSSSSLSKTKIYLDDNENVVYIEEGSSDPVAVTDTNVIVDNFLVTRFINPGGNDSVQIYTTVSYNTDNPRAKFEKSAQTAVSRATAATFDSDILPNTDNSFDIGNSSQKWRNAHFSGDVGIGVQPDPDAGLMTDRDIAITNSSRGLVFKSPGGSCFRLTINNSGNVATSSIACPDA